MVTLHVHRHAGCLATCARVRSRSDQRALAGTPACRRNGAGLWYKVNDVWRAASTLPRTPPLASPAPQTQGHPMNTARTPIERSVGTASEAKAYAGARWDEIAGYAGPGSITW